MYSIDVNKCVLISTYWNVNSETSITHELYVSVLISTYWNVNQTFGDLPLLHKRF